MVKILSEVPGIDFDLAGGDSFTPLLASVILGHLDVVKILAPRCDVNKTDMMDNSRNSPLQWAVARGHVDIAKYLATFPGVDVNQKGQQGVTAIVMAGGMKQAGLFDFFLDMPSVDKTAREPKGGDLLAVSTVLDDPQIFRKVLQMKIGDVNGKPNGTPLLVEVIKSKRSIEIVELLLAEEGIDAAASNEAAETALNIAEGQGNYVLIDMLRKKLGITLTPEEEEEEAATRIYALSGAAHDSYYNAPADPAALKPLLDKWAGKDSVVNGRHGEFSPFYNAARDGHLECLALLAATAGVNVNHTDISGYSGLMRCAAQGLRDAVDVILEVPGVNLVLRDVATHRSAMDLTVDDNIRAAIRAAMTPDEVASEAAIEAAIAGGKEILSAVKADDLAALQMLCQTWSGNKTALNLTDDSGYKDSGYLTPLMNVTSAEAARLLLNTPGTNVNAQDHDGKSALIHHFAKVHVEVVQELCKAPGIDFGVRDKAGLTALEQVPADDDQKLLFATLRPLLREAMGVALSAQEAAAEKLEVDTIVAGREVYAAAGSGDAERLGALITQHKNNAAVLNYRHESSYPLIKAIEEGHLGCIKLLTACAAVDVNVTKVNNWYGGTALMRAAANDDEETIKHMLSLPAVDVFAKDDNKGALECCYTEKSRDLLRAAMGIVLEGEDKALSSSNKIFEAVVDVEGVQRDDRLFDMHVLESIVEQWRHDAEWRDVVFGISKPHCVTPIARAVSNQQLEAIALLATVPGDHVNLHLSYYLPPLVTAAKEGHRQVVALLLSSFPNIRHDWRDYAGKSAADLASTLEIRRMIRAAAGIVFTAEEMEKEDAEEAGKQLIKSVQEDDQEAFKALLLQWGSSAVVINYRDEQQFCALSYALSHRRPWAARLLLAAEATDVNLPAYYHPLFEAAGQLEIVRLLLQHPKIDLVGYTKSDAGFDFEYREKTLLEYYSDRGHFEELALLREKMGLKLSPEEEEAEAVAKRGQAIFDALDALVRAPTEEERPERLEHFKAMLEASRGDAAVLNYRNRKENIDSTRGTTLLYTCVEAFNNAPSEKWLLFLALTASTST